MIAQLTIAIYISTIKMDAGIFRQLTILSLQRQSIFINKSNDANVWFNSPIAAELKYVENLNSSQEFGPTLHLVEAQHIPHQETNRPPLHKVERKCQQKEDVSRQRMNTHLRWPQ